MSTQHYEKCTHLLVHKARLDKYICIFKNVRFVQCLLTEHVQKNSKTKIPRVFPLTFVQG